MQPAPFSNMRFRVEIDAMQGTGAVEIIFPEARIIGTRRRSAAKSGRKTQMTTSVVYTNLILKRGVTRSGEWYEWWNAAREAKSRSRRNTKIILLDERAADADQWIFTDTLPVAYGVSNLNALGNEALIETLELTVGGFRALYQRPDGSR